MTAMADLDVAAACDRFGEDVWDVLAAAGHEHHSVTGDGFEVLAPSTADVVHVAVIDRRNGPLKGCGGWRMAAAQRLAPCRAALLAAGYGVAGLEDDGAVVVLIVTPTPDTAQAALAVALASRDT